MRRSLPLIAVLVGMLVCSASAFAAVAGHNPATRALEGAYKIALLERKLSDDGCYLSPNDTAAAIRNKTDLRVGVAKSFGSVRRQGVVFVIKRGASCDHLRMAFRVAQGLYVLDSNKGTIHLQGRRTGERPRTGPVRGLTIVSKGFQLSKANTTERLEVRCPGKTFPLGGGMTMSPAPGADGEGVYPHSFERLGAQRGFHVSVVVFDPDLGPTTSRKVTVQAACGRGVVPVNPSPHRTVFIRPGETKTATAKCPPRQQLVSGGFQRTDFRLDGGDYITESRAVGTRAWRVTGSAFGTGSGELTAIALCVPSKRPQITEVSASTSSLGAGQFASATTPACPAGRKLTFGGFSANGSQNAFFAEGSINRNNTWSASGFGFFGPVPSFTAYGYCLRAK
jgi:hypothetical protein